MGNNHSCSVQGICDISLKMHDNKVKILTDVRYMTGLKRNLISLGTLDELDFSYKVENGFMYVFKNNDPILTSTKKYGLSVLNGYSLLPVNIFSTYMVKSDKTDFLTLET